MSVLRLAFLAGLLSALLLPAIGRAADRWGDTLAPFFAEHCVRCHGEADRVKGQVDLHALRSNAGLQADPELLHDLIEVLEFYEMPPEDEPEPSGPERTAALGELKRLMAETLDASRAYPPTPMRRMNRFQYANAVQDLFELSVEVFSLPERMCREYGDYFQPAKGRLPDVVTVGSRPLGKSQLIEPRLAGVAAFPQDLRAEHGFDNRADHLTLSPLLMESLLRLGKSIVESHDFHRKTCGIWDWFFAEPDAGTDRSAAVRSRLQRFLGRAFRRPVDEATLDRYAGHVTGLIEAGVPFVDAMKEAAAAALASPRFFYLYHGGEEGSGTHRVDGYELASRLSFFLWGSIPDEALLEAAASGRLGEPEVLRGQVDRMLRDERLKRFCDSFPAQWLQLDRIVTSVPDPDRYPDFYFAKYRTSMDMMLEPLLLFEAVLVENRSVLNFLHSDFTYRSPRLQAWYGADPGGKKLGGPTRLRFERVPVTDRRQGGVITTAAVMTMTSGPKRTHPITRGAWMATAIFNDPPDPPPADVPPLQEKGEAVEHLTVREKLAVHRKRADCAGCHEQIDPLGFALENYGPAGEWREVYANGRDIDVSGRLFRQRPFDDVVAFKEALLAEKDRFVRGFAGHLLSYALGRELSAADAPALDAVTEAAGAEEHRFHALLHAIVQSEPFQQKTIPESVNRQP